MTSRMITELNKVLDNELKKNESFLERIGRYCAKQRGSYFDKSKSQISALTGAGSILVGFGTIIAQMEGIIAQSPSNSFFALGCMALSGAVVISSIAHHTITSKVLDPIISDINFQNFNPEKVGKIFSNIVSKKLIENKNLTSDQKYQIFDEFKDSFVDKVSCHYNKQSHNKDFSNTIKGMDLDTAIHKSSMELFRKSSAEDFDKLMKSAAQMFSKECCENKNKNKSFEFGI